MSITGRRRGQALLLVVLLMLVVVLIGVLFVAVVSFNQEQSTRMSDVVKAQKLAEAGLRYADYMLTYSPEGADWRPPFKPYNPATPAIWPIPPVFLNGGGVSPNQNGPDGLPLTEDDYYSEDEIRMGWTPGVNPAGNPVYTRYGFTRYPEPGASGLALPNNAPLDALTVNGGHFLLRVTYDPNPPYEGNNIALGQTYPQGDPLSRFIKLECIGVVDETNFVWRSMVAYKPLGLTDHILWVTDKAKTGKPVTLGFSPWMDMQRNGTYEAGDFLRLNLNGPLRFNTALALGGVNGASPATPAQGSTQVNLTTTPTAYSNPALWRPTGGGYLRRDTLESLNGIQESGGAQSTTVNLFNAAGPAGGGSVTPSAGAFNSYGGFVRDNQRGPADADRSVDRIEGPDLFRRDPATGQSRYLALTRDSGAVLTRTGLTVNAGRYGHGRGVYIDNTGDIQYGHDTGRLLQDFMAAAHDRAAISPKTDSGWDELRNVYNNAKGVEITLYPDTASALREAALSRGDAVSWDNSLNPTLPFAAGELWIPGVNVAADTPANPVPVIRLARHDGAKRIWKIADPANPGTVGDDTGTNVMYIPYPPAGNQVIYAEGNVRIHGVLPRDLTATGRYNLTVVSGGTIYIDGQILSPQDVYGRQTSEMTGGHAGIPDEQNTYVALLAQDCVVVNPTQLTPLSNHGGVDAKPDDGSSTAPSMQHWTLPKDSDSAVDYAYLTWRFGAPAANQVNLLAYQGREKVTPAAPVSALMQLWTYNELYNKTQDPLFAPLRTWYDFDGTVGNPVHNHFQILDASQTNADNSTPATTQAVCRDDRWLPLLWDAVTHWPYTAYPQDSTIFEDNPDRGNLSLMTLPWTLTASPKYPTPNWMSTAIGDLNGARFNAAALFGSAPDWRVATTYTLNDLVTSGGARYRSLQASNLGNDPATTPGYWLLYTGDVDVDYWLKRVKLEEVDSSGRAQPTLHAKINALMYAQNGCFFVLPGRYFDDTARGDAATRLLRYNYDIEIRGAIAESFHAPPEAWRDWQDKWAWPAYSGVNLGWGTIRYLYDETLLADRAEPPMTLAGAVRSANLTRIDAGNAINLPKLPLLPTCPGLIYEGRGG